MPQKKNKVKSKVRRSNGMGSIYQQTNGLWTGKIWVTNHKTGERKRQTVYGHSETEVADKLVKITSSMEPLNGLYGQKTFGELFEAWLLVFKKASVTPRTFEGNIRNYRLHIQPFLENMDITEVTAPVIQQVINEMLLKKGLSTNMARKVKFLFNQFFEYAIEMGFVENNPTLRVKVRNRNPNLTRSEKEFKAIPKEERMEFLKALNTHQFLKPLCMTMMFAGLRIGETLALKWENIDFKNKTISVKNGITQVPKFDNEGNVVERVTVVGNTKTTCSVRTVPIPDILVEALQDWRKCQWVKKELSGVNLIAKESLVFCNNNGHVRTYSGARRSFDRFAKKHGFFGKIHFHTLRHTYSNMLFEMKENPKIIQALLGHKSVKTTLMVYNSVDDSYFAEATNKLNQLYNSEKMEEYQILKEKQDIPALKRDIETDNGEENDFEEMSEDAEILMLEKLLAEKRKHKKKQHDVEM